MDGVLSSPPVQKYDALVFYKPEADAVNNTIRASIINQSEIADTSIYANAVGGFYTVLENGQIAERLRQVDNGEPHKDQPRHPRSAAGLSEDGRFLFLLVADGRRLKSGGLNEAELAMLLRRLGSYNGLNLDGGGSSALAMRFPDGKTKTVNTPVHNNVPGSQRAVATCLGIAYNADYVSTH